MPGVFSGSCLHFTMSLDDFIITHFTRGAQIDTLSTKIYAVRKELSLKCMRAIDNPFLSNSDSSCNSKPQECIPGREKRLQ